MRKGLPEAGAEKSSAELQFRRLLDALPAGAYTCDPEGLITYYNRHAAEMWGRSPKLNDPADRFCGSFKLFATDGTSLSHSKCWMARALRDGKPYNGCEIVVERPDGTRLTGLAHANPIHDKDGRLIGAVNVVVDISDRKREEQKLRQADRSKNEFLATLAHELRNPLAPIRNVVQILQIKEAGNAGIGEALEIIERQVQQMTRLIDDLLDLSRITADRLQLRRQPIDLGEVLRAAVETAQPLISANGHKLVVSEPKPPLTVDADLTRLAQVVSNLLINAAKYTPRGGRIQLQARRSGRDVVVTVRDNGTGIARDMLPRIFDLFMQGGRENHGSHEGLGIGLALARRLAQMHGGTLGASSAGPGKGAEFTVRLPLVAGGTARKRESRTARPAAVASLRVLVVDDNRASAGSLRTLLQLVGHDVRVANHGAQALRLAAEFRPHAVLLDIGLPKMTGYEVARRLRHQPRGSGLQLIAVTGFGQVSDRERSRLAGFDHHLVKPVEIPELLRLLEHRRPADTAAKAGNGHWQDEKTVQVLPLPLGTRGNPP
jgi:two-component system CheB/CheR fusion protein